MVWSGWSWGLSRIRRFFIVKEVKETYFAEKLREFFIEGNDLMCGLFNQSFRSLELILNVEYVVDTLNRKLRFNSRSIRGRSHEPNFWLDSRNNRVHSTANPGENLAKNGSRAIPLLLNLFITHVLDAFLERYFNLEAATKCVGYRHIILRLQ